MQRQQKHEFVESLTSTLEKTPLVVVARYGGNDVNGTNELRRKLETTGITYRVVKNTLARRAMADSGMAPLADHLGGMSLVILSTDDPIASAKAIREVLGNNDKIIVKAGYWDGQLLDSAGVKAVADMPSREELLSTLLATLQEPGRQLLSLIEAPARDLITLLSNYENKLSSADES